MKTKARVLIATIPSLSEGGVGSLLRFMCNFLNHEDYDLNIVTNSATHHGPDNLSVANFFRSGWKIGMKKSLWEGANVFTFGRRFSYIEPFHYIGNLGEWIRLAREYDVHIVVSGFNSCGLAFAEGGFRFISWIATTFDDDRNGRKQTWPIIRQWIDTAWSPLLRRNETYILHQCRKNLVISNYTARLISNRYKLKPLNLNVMPYPIDTDWFSPAEPLGNLNIISVGRWNDPRKNIDMLVKSFGIVNRKIPKTRLIIVGSVPEYLPNLVKENAIDPNMILVTGSVSSEDLRIFYRKGTIFVLPSYQEGLGIVGLEAMSCGLPIVATMCGGPEDYVLDGVNGYLVPINNYETMAEKIISLLEKPYLIRNMSANARQHILDHYSIPAVSSILKHTFKEVWPDFF